MKNLVLRIWEDDRGFIVSAEIVLVMTIGVLGMIVGINAVASAVNNELNDISGAIGAMDQSYWYSGHVKLGHSGVVGSAFADAQDVCDCTSIVPTPPPVKTQSYPNLPPHAVPVPRHPIPAPPHGHVVPPPVPEQTVFPPHVLHPPVPPCDPCEKAKSGKPVPPRPKFPKGKHPKFPKKTK